MRARAVPLPLVLVTALAVAALPMAAQGIEPPALTGRVTDLAGVLDRQQRTHLEEKLAEYERSTGHQFAVLVVPGLDGVPLEDFSIRTAERWRLGDKRRDDGLLVVVALRERSVRIEVGYGLEGAIPDALAGRIIHERIVPRFKQQDFSGGLEAGLDALMQAAQGEALGPPARPPDATGWPPRWTQVLPLLVFLFLFLLLGGKRRLRGRPPVVFFPPLGGGRRSGWGGGGGFGGGGFRGGGGRFGGGGASGRW
jgi:uncharacterized protein